MKDGLLEKITSRGYWRVNFQPVVDAVKLPTVESCKQVVEESALELRGWEYPAVLLGSPEVVRERHENYFELSNDWWNHIEFWRMYQSGQFLHYLALREDWLQDDGWASQQEKQVPPGTRLGVVGTVYQATEIYAFLQRLVQKGLYDEGVAVSVRLVGMKGRALWLDDPMRIRFSFERKTDAEQIEWKQVHTKDEVLSKAPELARDVLRHVFDRFGWQPNEEQLRADQDKLLSKRL